MLVTVITTHVVTLIPFNAAILHDLRADVLYSYHLYRIENGIVQVMLDHNQRWYSLTYFRPHELCYN